MVNLPSPDDSVAMHISQLTKADDATVVTARGAAADWLRRFEEVYREAGDSVERVPWAQSKPNPMVIEWLDRDGRAMLRPGARVCVAGCGLGHDVAALNDRGYDAVGLDACESAISSACSIHTEHAGAFRLADLSELPSDLRHRFDAVVEVHTLQSMPGEYREAMAKGMASLLKRHGVLVSVSRGVAPARELCTPAGPPFDLPPEEVSRLMAGVGLVPQGEAVTRIDGRGVRRTRCVFGCGG